jgi:hypothetical protein
MKLLIDAFLQEWPGLKLIFCMALFFSAGLLTLTILPTAEQIPGQAGMMLGGVTLVMLLGYLWFVLPMTLLFLAFSRSNTLKLITLVFSGSAYYLHSDLFNGVLQGLLGLLSF